MLTVCSWLPLRLLHAIAAVWGYLLYVIPGRARDTSYRNLEACFPRKKPAEIALLTRQSLQNTACTALEMGKSWLLPMDQSIAMVSQVEGAGLLRDAYQEKRGVILLTPHLSNWEIFGFYASQQFPTTYMYQPPKVAALDRLLRKTRSRGGINLVPTNAKGIAQLLAALRRGELVGLLPDQVPAEKGGILAPFFAESALTMTLASKLIRRTGARAICGFAQRLPRSRGFRVVFRQADESIYADDLAQSVTGLNKSVEQCVEMAVSQYQWEYKRFRRRPGGEKFYK